MATRLTALNFPSSGPAGKESKRRMKQIVIAETGATIIQTSELSQKLGPSMQRPAGP